MNRTKLLNISAFVLIFKSITYKVMIIATLNVYTLRPCKIFQAIGIFFTMGPSSKEYLYYLCK